MSRAEREQRVMSQAGGRPNPLPDRPWIMYQEWHNVLFCSWPIAVEELRPLVPPELELDTFEGTAWFSLLPMVMERLHLRFLPPVPGTSNFNEINLRTYVRYQDEPGVYFFKIFAESRLGALMARLAFHLPYEYTEIDLVKGKGTLAMHTVDGTINQMSVRYQPGGTPTEPPAGSREHFLIERYADFAADKAGAVYRGDIQHARWKTQPVEAEFDTLTIPAAAGLKPL
ncbi:MAG: DUF2071 domain-containing protein, partial [Anaerolineales bacterium]|nr:DUF2071 domain-containing protein [Anaerolineales bacterium]